MAIDPATGMNIPSPADELRRPRHPDEPLPPERAANDELGIPADIEERRPTFWFPLAIAVVLMLGLGYYFYGPYFGPVG